MEAVTKAIELKPDAPEQYVALGNALVMLDRDEEALEYFDKALEIDPKLDYALYGKGGALFYLEEYEESITYLETYLELEPTDVDVLDALVYAYEMTGDYEETIKYNDIVIEIDEDENLIYNIDYKGILLTENGQLDEAEQLYEKMLEEHPLEKGIAYYGLSFIHIYRGEIDEGLDQLEDAAAEDPNLIDYAASDPMFEEVYDNERFIELVGADEDSFNGL
ncbi:tetratricopeptide repeat protein [Oceanobacillus sp. FSL W8-0428]|uniref:tetratricopeptide repeat protein n=1 Tax=unclassified Oceanobacillus TaxID=2630292 RepID=UPI0030DBE690